MDRQLASAIIDRLAEQRGDETSPTEDVIDLARVLQYVLEQLRSHNGQSSS